MVIWILLGYNLEFSTYLYLFIIEVLVLVLLNVATICGNDFTQHIPLHISRGSRNTPKPIPAYLPD